MKQSEDDNPLELYKAQNIRNFEEYWNQLPETTIAWLAGLLQGEAYFYIDDRNRSTSNDPNYRPPPAIQINGIRLSMIEKDLMNEVAKLVDQNLNLEKRLVFISKANNFVYKVNVSARNKVQIILKSIFPYVRGAKKLTIIQEQLDLCEKYNRWCEQGGKTQAARLSNKASQQSKRKEKFEK